MFFWISVIDSKLLWLSLLIANDILYIVITLANYTKNTCRVVESESKLIIALMIAVFMGAIDSTIAILALPTITVKQGANLSSSRQRDAIEKAFRVFKTDLDTFPLRNHKESTIRGILFVFFISLIIRSALLRGMESSGLLKKYSLERMILEPLSKISWW